MDITLIVRWEESGSTGIAKQTDIIIKNYLFGLATYIESYLKNFFDCSNVVNMYVSVKCEKRCLSMFFNRFCSYNYNLKKRCTYNFSIEGINYKRSTIKKGIQEFSEKFLNFCIEDEKKCLTKNKLNYEKI